MRVRLATSIAATALALPLVITSVASASQSAHPVVHQLAVNVRDASPHAASITVLNVATGASRHMAGSGRVTLRAGTYNIAVWFGLGGPSVTLADQVVDLNRNREVILSPNGGVPVFSFLNNPGASEDSLELAVFAGGHWATPVTPVGSMPMNPVPSLPIGGTYVVPMTSSLVNLYVYSVWQKAGSTASDPSPYRYDIINEFRGGLPHAVDDIRTRTPQLARVDVTARSFDASQQVTLNLDPLPQPVGGEPLTASTPLGAAPAHLVSYRSPGYLWLADTFWRSPTTAPTARNELEEYSPRETRYGLGHFAETWGQAIFAPMPFSLEADPSNDGKYLLAGLIGIPWNDPAHQADGAEYRQEQASLYSGGKLLATDPQGSMLEVRYPAKDQVYDLRVVATRLPGAQMSSSITGDWRFSAGPSVLTRTFSITLSAAGLNDANQARAGSVTTITLGISTRPDSLTYPIRSVRAWSSANDGATWQRVTVRKVHTRYEVVIRNAQAAGYTSVRVYLADSHGNSEELTVIHAYGVS